MGSFAAIEGTSKDGTDGDAQGLDVLWLIHGSPSHFRNLHG